MAKCKGCGASIVFIRSVGDKMIPCNPEQVRYWEKPKARGKIVTPNGEVISCVFEGDPQKATGMGYIPHFATCPKAADFKRARK